MNGNTTVNGAERKEGSDGENLIENPLVTSGKFD
jgi:hypothetical protein